MEIGIEMEHYSTCKFQKAAILKDLREDSGTREIENWKEIKSVNKG